MDDHWRLIVDLDDPPSATAQMAADAALLDEVAAGAGPALRIYRWRSPALTLGRFQPEDQVDGRRCRELGIDVARRPTGGRALLHGGDLTYAVALLRRVAAGGSIDDLYRHVARGLIDGLARLGVDAEVAHHDGRPGPVCFAAALGSDLRVGRRKICGSAQVQRGPAMLQHGSILLDRLDVDETSLLRFDTEADRAAARTRLADATVTLEELGVAVDFADVGRAIVEGFEAALGVEFDTAFDLHLQLNSS